MVCANLNEIYLDTLTVLVLTNSAARLLAGWLELISVWLIIEVQVAAITSAPPKFYISSCPVGCKLSSERVRLYFLQVSFCLKEWTSCTQRSPY